MQHQKLFDLLAQLDSQEQRSLGGYLQLVGAPALLTDLLQALLAHHPGYALDAAACRALSAQLWPDSAYRPARLRNRLSQLYQLAMGYLAAQALRRDEPLQQRLALGELQQRRLSRNFEIELKATRRQAEEAPQITSEGFFHRYHLAELANSYYGLRELRTEDDSLLQKLHWLDHYYYLVLLRESCELLNRSQILGAAYAEQVPFERLAHIPTQPGLWAVPLIRAYYLVLSMLRQSSDPEPFRQLKALLAEAGTRFLPEEARALYRHAQNYCIRRINQGQPQYLAEVLELYQAQLQAGIIFVQGQLPHTDFKNITTAALRLKQFEWVQDFLERYRERVPPEQRDNVYQFCRASFHYESGQHDQVLRLLRTVSFSDDLYQISARLLLLRTLYETGDHESLAYSIDALGHYLKRNRSLSRALRQQHLHFLQHLRRLNRLAEQTPRPVNPETWQTQLERLRDALQSTQGVSHLSWLRGQVQALAEQAWHAG